MTKKIAVISDIHGCHKTLMALIAKIPGNYEIILAGDLIDRGPDSAGVVRLAMDNKLRCVLGNHEDMMLFSSGRPQDGQGRYLRLSDWHKNGAHKALDSWGGTVPENVLNWAESLPMAIVEGGFEISHTGYGGFEKADRFTKLWHRGELGHNNLYRRTDFFRVFGHTQRKEPWITPGFAMIDTGCAYKDRDLGVLTAFLIPDKTIIQQECLDL
jgi:serine/threonine protein phosphatase 1